jgi:hypothetical protein
MAAVRSDLSWGPERLGQLADGLLEELLRRGVDSGNLTATATARAVVAWIVRTDNLSTLDVVDAITNTFGYDE